MKVVFFGGGAVAVAVLRVIAAVHEVCLVVTPPPRKAGRKLTLHPPPAAVAAAALGLPVVHEASAAVLQNIAPDGLLVCDYGRLLSADCLAVASPLNVHPSLLPRWRGAAPITRALLSGDSITGVTIMRMNEAMDCGDIVAQTEVPITPATTGGHLQSQLASAGAALLLDVLADSGKFTPLPQDSALATYAKKITADDRHLNFAESAALCLRRIRAFAPAPGAFCYFAGERLKVLDAELVKADESMSAGRLIAADTELVVACASGAIRLTTVQRSGRAALSVSAFLRGCRLPIAKRYVG